MATIFKWQAETVELLSDEVQKRLARWNRERLAPGLPQDRKNVGSDLEMLRLEDEFLKLLRWQVGRLAATVPRRAGAFV